MQQYNNWCNFICNVNYVKCLLIRTEFPVSTKKTIETIFVFVEECQSVEHFVCLKLELTYTESVFVLIPRIPWLANAKNRHKLPLKTQQFLLWWNVIECFANKSKWWRLSKVAYRWRPCDDDGQMSNACVSSCVCMRLSTVWLCWEELVYIKRNTRTRWEKMTQQHTNTRKSNAYTHRPIYAAIASKLTDFNSVCVFECVDSILTLTCLRLVRSIWFCASARPYVWVCIRFIQ